jgi:hypothetical protein
VTRRARVCRFSPRASLRGATLTALLVSCLSVSASADDPVRRRGSTIKWVDRSGAHPGQRALPGRSWDETLPSWVRSVEVVRDDEPIYRAPAPQAARRGAAELGAHLPVYAVNNALGCDGAWFQVGPEAWICESGVQATDVPALRADAVLRAPESGLPHDYYFVGELGSFGYRELESAETGTPATQLEPGFAIAVLRSKERDPNDMFGLTSHSLWVPLRDVRPARPSLFAGERRALGASEVQAWARDDKTPLYDAPNGRIVERVARRTPLVALSRVSTRQGKTFLRLADERYVEATKVFTRTAAPPPAGLLRPNERYIDVDLGAQVLTVYEGETALFSTLISSGRGTGDSEEATPLGEHRLWVKLVSSDMDNLENEEASRYYSMQAVPWVMYFEGGYGLHGAFWHDDFGKRRSHGCVNLSPRDASQIFQLTSPHLPAGWSAVLPTDYEPGTLVRVRDSLRNHGR